ncbi:hypothetical protein GCM10010964_39710 [Caldovatus sediminis]|uniref:Uncharacterized protein n=1 Tax=Caldovatus sediminis TaxID=2041189 RepID=A0A8J2ZED3_9PROT|nr:hypothetical protein GCM10010964_39710 [Caldovatus sediminis]
MCRKVPARSSARSAAVLLGMAWVTGLALRLARRKGRRLPGLSAVPRAASIAHPLAVRRA